MCSLRMLISRTIVCTETRHTLIAYVYSFRASDETLHLILVFVTERTDIGSLSSLLTLHIQSLSLLSLCCSSRYTHIVDLEVLAHLAANNMHIVDIVIEGKH